MDYIFFSDLSDKKFIIRGLPVSTGDYSFTLQIKELSLDQVFTKEFKISVLPGLTSSSAIDLPGGIVGQNVYSFYKFSNYVGKSYRSVSLISGSLPPGLTFLGSEIYGQPTTAGDFAFALQFKGDDPSQVITKEFKISIVPRLRINLEKIVDSFDGLINQPYNYQLTASGGVLPYTWSAESSPSLPNGLILSSDGLISGIPNTIDLSHYYTFKVTDSSVTIPQENSTLFSIQINSPLSIETSSLSNGKVGELYIRSIRVIGGQSPYVTSVIAGTLPEGLSLSDDDILSGTPLKEGSYAFTIEVSDSANPKNTVTKEFTVIIDN